MEITQDVKTKCDSFSSHKSQWRLRDSTFIILPAGHYIPTPSQLPEEPTEARGETDMRLRRQRAKQAPNHSSGPGKQIVIGTLNKDGI